MALLKPDPSTYSEMNNSEGCAKIFFVLVSKNKNKNPVRNFLNHIPVPLQIHEVFPGKDVPMIIRFYLL
jgi:hypothetical protein